MIRLLIFVILVHVAFSQTRYTTPESISQSTCDQEVVDLYGIPRIDFGGRIADNDLGSYAWMKCRQPQNTTSFTYDQYGNLVKTVVPPSNTSKEDCTFSLDILDFVNGSLEETAPMRIVQGYVLLFAFAMFIGVLALCIGCTLGVRRYCCFCSGGGCCSRYPTPGLCCGIGQHKANGRSYIGYSSRTRWLTRIWMWIFMILMCTWIIILYTRGTNRLVESLIVLTDAPRPIADLLHSLDQPAKQALMSIATVTIPSMIQSINQTIYQSVDLNQVDQNLQCVVYQIENNLPNVTMIYNAADQINNQFDKTIAISNATFYQLFQQSINQANNQRNPVISQLNALALPIDQSLFIKNNMTVAINKLGFFISETVNQSTGLPIIINDLYEVSNISNPTRSQSINQTIDQSNALAVTSQPINQTALFYNNLLIIQSIYQSISNLSVTSDRLSRTQASALLMEPVLKTIDQSINQLNQTMGSLVVNLHSTRQSINLWQSSIQSVDLTYALGLMELMNRTISQSFNMSFIIQQAELTHAIVQAVPCLNQLFDSVQSINNSLIQLPSTFDPILQVASKLNLSINASISSVDQAINQAIRSQSLLSNLSVVFKLNDVQQLINQTNNQLEVAKQAFIQASNTQFLTNLTNCISDFNSTISNLTSINPSTNNSLTRLESIKQSVLQLLLILIPDIRQFYSRGYCPIDGRECLINSDCPSNLSNNEQCVISNQTILPSKRCRLNGTITCSIDADCSANDRCLVDRSRLQSLSANLSAMSASVPWVERMTIKLESINQSINQTDLSGLTNGSDVTVSTFQSIDLPSLTSQLNQVSSQLNNISIDQYATELKSINQSIGGLVRGELSQLDQAVDVAVNARPGIIEASELVHNIYLFWANRLPQLLESLGHSNMESQFEQGGLSTMIDTMLQLIDQSTQAVKNRDYLEPTDLVHTWLTDDLRNYLDVLSTDQAIKYGAINFFASLVFRDRLIDLNNQPLQFSIDHDSSGESYPEDRLCLTDYCIENSVRNFTDRSVSDLSYRMLPLESSPSTLLNGLLLVPSAIIIIGLLTTMMYKSPWLTSCFASINLCIMFVFMIITFFVIGAIWPFTVVLASDICNGGTSVVNQLVHSKAEMLCDSISGTMVTQVDILSNQTLQACQLSVLDSNFTVDLPSTFESVFGSRCSTNNPLSSLFSVLKVLAFDLAVNQTDDALTSMAKGKNRFIIRPSILTIVHNTSINVGNVLQVGVNDVEAMLSCDRLAEAVTELKSNVCCQPVAALYWSLSPWYLMAFSVLLCGIPASLLGRKRFASSIWGPYYEKSGIPIRHSLATIPYPRYVQYDKEKNIELQKLHPFQIEDSTQDLSTSKNESMLRSILVVKASPGHELNTTPGQSPKPISQEHSIPSVAPPYENEEVELPPLPDSPITKSSLHSDISLPPLPDSPLTTSLAYNYDVSLPPLPDSPVPLFDEEYEPGEMVEDTRSI